MKEKLLELAYELIDDMAKEGVYLTLDQAMEAVIRNFDAYSVIYG